MSDKECKKGTGMTHVQRARVRSYTTLAHVSNLHGRKQASPTRDSVASAEESVVVTDATESGITLAKQSVENKTHHAHRLHGIYPLLLSQLPEFDDDGAGQNAKVQQNGDADEVAKTNTILRNSIDSSFEFMELRNGSECLNGTGSNDSNTGSGSRPIVASVGSTANADNNMLHLKCHCPQEYLIANFCLSPDGAEKPVHPQPTLDFHERFGECTTCKKRPAAYLCTVCWCAFCPEHAKTHFTANPAHHIMCRYEVWQYEECFWCFKCRGFSQCEEFDRVLEPLFVTKGSFMPKLISDKHSEYFCSEQLKCGVTTVQGWRTDNEDAHIVSLRMPKSNAALFAVFDGHGGPLVARASAQLLGDMIDDLLPAVGTRPLQTDGKEDIYAALPPLELDGIEPRHGVAGVMSKALITVDEKMEKHFNNDQAGTTGSTANIVLLLPYTGTEKGSVDTADGTKVKYSRVVCANCGDSRAVMGMRDGTARTLSVDQRPTDQKERLRVEAAGGTVVDDRVEGLLAVSRALGDYEFKQNAQPQYLQPVTALPEITEYTLIGAEAFIIVACDGIWDVVSSEEAVEFVTEQLLRNQNDAVLAAEALVDRCLASEMREDGVGMDNMSVIIILL